MPGFKFPALFGPALLVLVLNVLLIPVLTHRDRLLQRSRAQEDSPETYYNVLVYGPGPDEDHGPTSHQDRRHHSHQDDLDHHRYHHRSEYPPPHYRISQDRSFPPPRSNHYDRGPPVVSSSSYEKNHFRDHGPTQDRRHHYQHHRFEADLRYNTDRYDRVIQDGRRYGREELDSDRSSVRSYNYYNFRRNHLPPGPDNYHSPTPRPLETKTGSYDPFTLTKGHKPTHAPPTSHTGKPIKSSMPSIQSGDRRNTGHEVTIPGVAVTVSNKDLKDFMYTPPPAEDTEPIPTGASEVNSTTATNFSGESDTDVGAEPVVPTPSGDSFKEPIKENPTYSLQDAGFHKVHAPTPVPANPPRTKWADFSRPCESYFECDFRPPEKNFTTGSQEASATVWFTCDGKFCLCEMFGRARDDRVKWRIKWSKKSNTCIADNEGPCGTSDGLTVMCEVGYQCVNNQCQKPKPPRPPKGNNNNNSRGSKGGGANKAGMEGMMKNATALDCPPGSGTPKLDIFSFLFFPNVIIGDILNQSKTLMSPTRP